MHKRPYSEEDIFILKDCVYIPPQPLHTHLVIFFTIFFPFGLLYLLYRLHKNANNAVYLLSKCKTEASRERLIAFLKSNPQSQHARHRENQRIIKSMSSIYVSDRSSPSYYSPNNAYRG